MKTEVPNAYFIGIDIGSQGLRIVLIDVGGNLVGSKEEEFPLSNQSREEQSPQLWWASTHRLLQDLLLPVDKEIRKKIKALAVTSTSGTVIPLNAQNEPLHPALMYSDPRSAEQGRRCKEAAQLYNPDGYTGFNASSGLSKMVWFVEQFPDKVPQIKRWVHAADYITGKLSKRWGITDYTNAFKSGFDVHQLQWPAYLWEQLPIKQEWLPEVVASGTPVGCIDPQLANELGLSAQMQIVAGITDGCASQLASGAVHPGDWNTTIGTTLVIKGVTKQAIKDPAGSLYNHRHPEGLWMPGGASNIGADWITRDFKNNLEWLNQQAKELMPTGHMAYPLRQDGERFPFIAPQARGFQPEGLSQAELYTANMEGVAYIERYAFELIERLSGEKVKAVFTAGGGSNSDAWLAIRSNVLQLPVYKMKHVTGAVGAAILAASKTHFTSVSEAADALLQIEKEVHPQKDIAMVYEKNYAIFLNLLIHKGYISSHTYA